MSFHHCSVSQLGYDSIGIDRRKMTGTVSLRREALAGVKTKRINDKGILQRERESMPCEPSHDEATPHHYYNILKGLNVWNQFSYIWLASTL